MNKRNSKYLTTRFRGENHNQLMEIAKKKRKYINLIVE